MFVWGGGGGGSEPVRLEEKSALNFFFGLGSRSSPAAGAAPAAPMRPEAETAGRGRDPPVWSWLEPLMLTRSTAFVDLRQLVYCEAVKGHTCIHCAKWAWFCIAFYLVSCRFSDRWRGRFKQPSRGRPSRPSRSMENRRWGLEIRPCTVSLSTPSVESARELAPSLSARRRTSGGRCARIPLTWGGASTS